MRCPNCHSDTPNGFRYCLQCGEDLGDPTVVQPHMPTGVQITEKRQRGPVTAMIAGTFSGLLIGVAIVLGLIGAYVIFTYFYGGDPLGIAVLEPASTANKSARPKPTPTQQATPIPQLKGTVKQTEAAPEMTQPRPSPQVVETMQPERVIVLQEQFHIAPGSYFAKGFIVNGPAHLVGSFESSSPIKVFVTGPGNTMWFNSGKINGGPISAQLGAGSYYLTFNNQDALFTGQNVRAMAYLEY